MNKLFDLMNNKIEHHCDRHDNDESITFELAKNERAIKYLLEKGAMASVNLQPKNELPELKNGYFNYKRYYKITIAIKKDSFIFFLPYTPIKTKIEERIFSILDRYCSY